MARSLNNLGTVHQALADYSLAARYCERSLAIHLETGNEAGQSLNFNNLGSVRRLEGKPEQAEQMRQKASRVQSIFIVIACAEATLHREGAHEIASGADAARALAPLAGRFASWLFALGLANASLFAASILPLATAYSVCEGLGLEAGVDRSFGEAPEFYWLYTALIVGGGGMILLPGAPLLRSILVSQIMNGVLLPFVLVFMLVLVNRESIMGRFTNGRAYNLVAWATTVAQETTL